MPTPNTKKRARPPTPGKLDAGIRKAVEQLQAAGIETFESCEGGKGHAYPEPTVAFHGVPEAGWRAVSVCLALGLPVGSLRRVWNVLDANEPTGPHWELTFTERVYMEKKPSAAEPVRIDLPFDEAIRRALKVKPEHREPKKPPPKKKAKNR